jgi:fumarate hydratase, class II
MKMRTESDAFGSIEVPADCYYGAQTQRALELFGADSTEQFPTALIHATGLQKLAAVRANVALNVLDPLIGEAIARAAQEVWEGALDTHFPLPVWQTGSGTQTNMNANEVIANRANELLGSPLGTRKPVHPNDHVNRSQSSNDSFPTVMHIAVLHESTRSLHPALTALRNEFRRKAAQFATNIKIGRTHMMDAVPMTVGQGFDTFAHQIDATIERLDAAIPRLSIVPQGGTAIGTGLNAPPTFDVVFCDQLSQLSGHQFSPARSKFEAMGAHDELVSFSGVLNVLAVSLIKIANDLRLLDSGPRCGLQELVLPPDGLSSSIMPGKTNPTIAEVVLQVAFQVVGNHATITLAGASGSFELNVTKPLIAYNLLQSIRLLSAALPLMTRNLVAGIEVNEQQIAANISRAILPVTALNPILGYDAVARITKHAFDSNATPRQAAIELGLLTGEDYDRHVNLEAMTNAKLDLSKGP